MRYNCKIDDNQKQIVETLKRCGATVQSLSAVRRGCPDILVGFQGKNYLFEIKRNSKQKLSDDEKRFALSWRGQTNVIFDAKTALSIMGVTFPAPTVPVNPDASEAPSR